jgi:hypothetical protein
MESTSEKVIDTGEGEEVKGIRWLIVPDLGLLEFLQHLK